MPRTSINTTKNYYDILGIPPDSSAAEIKAARQKKSIQFHPDRPAGNEEIFKDIQEAREVLEDPGSRAFYDRSRNESSQGSVHVHNEYRGNSYRPGMRVHPWWKKHQRAKAAREAALADECERYDEDGEEWDEDGEEF